MQSKLLEVLVCPVTKGKLEYDRDKQQLISRAAKLAYPIVDGVPHMLVDAAMPLSEDIGSPGSLTPDGTDPNGSKSP